MSVMRSAWLVALASGMSILVIPVLPALAEDRGELGDLEQVIEEQQRQLEAQQEQIDQQEEALERLRKEVESAVSGAKPRDSQEPGAERRATVVVIDADTPPPGRLSNMDKHDQDVPTGSSVQHLKPTVTFTEPLTNTQVGIGGFAEFQIIHDTNGLNANEFDTFLIPVPEDSSQTKFSINASRLGFSSQTPVGFGRINVLITTDFNGELDAPEPRLRVAYGEFIHDELDFAVLAGQAFSTMLNLKSVPETLDFAGPTGYWARRQPQLRFTKMFERQVFLDISVETPENTVYDDRGLPGGGVSGAGRRTRLPDLAVALAWDDETNGYLDNIRLIGLFRDLRAEDAATGADDATLGWAFGVSGKVNTPFLSARDNVKFAIHYGEGYGGQLKSGPADAVFDPVDLELETIGVLSAYGGFQHWWTDTIRSNAVFGYVDADNPSFAAGDRLDETWYLAANLVWNPWKSVTLGVEYLRGRLENVDGESGDADRFILHSKWEFF